MRVLLAVLAAATALATGSAHGQGTPPAPDGAASPPAGSAAPAPPRAPSPLPVLRLGALLPLSGPAAWFAREIQAGLELAVAEVGPRAPRGARAAPGTAKIAPAATTTAGAASPDPLPATPGAATGEPGRATAEPVEPPDRVPAVTLALEVVGIQTLDVKAAERGAVRLVAAGTQALVTATPTPALAAFPIAAGRDTLLVHQGLPDGRLPAATRTLLEVRPSPAARARVLVAHTRQAGLRRLAVLAAGDEFGRQARAVLVDRWRRGGELVHDESLTADAADLPERLNRVTRLAPDAVALTFRGVELGEIAARLRQGGYRGPLLALDDDRAAWLQAGSGLGECLVVSDAFFPEAGTRSERFARAFEAREGRPPSRHAANAYEVAFLLAEAARDALEAGRGLAGSRLREALLTRRRFPSLYGGQLSVRDDGTLERPLALLQVVDGRASFLRYVSARGPTA